MKPANLTCLLRAACWILSIVYFILVTILAMNGIGAQP